MFTQSEITTTRFASSTCLLSQRGFTPHPTSMFVEFVYFIYLFLPFFHICLFDLTISLLFSYLTFFFFSHILFNFLILHISCLYMKITSKFVFNLNYVAFLSQKRLYTHILFLFSPYLNSLFADKG